VLSTFLREPGGGFGPRRDVPLGGAPSSLAGGDLDGDGRPELAVADFNHSAVLLLRDSGAGYVLVATLPVARSPRFVILADLDRDGDLDLATANDAGADANGSVTLLFNPGAGSFRPEPESMGTRLDPDPVPVAALREDPLPGDGRRVDLPVGKSPIMLTAADLDHDGNVDLAVNEVGDDAYSLLWGLGQGRFRPAISRYSYAHWTAVGDLDEDGRPELVMAMHDGYSLMIFANTPSGFSVPTYVSTTSIPRSVEVADFDSDGHLDLLCVGEVDGNLEIKWGDGHGHFAEGPRCWGGTGGRSLTITARPDGALEACVPMADDDALFLRSFSPSEFVSRAAQAYAAHATRSVIEPGMTLGMPRPNPSNGVSTIAFELAAEQDIRLDVLDVRGRLVRTLVENRLEAGAHDVSWDGRDRMGGRVRRGIYFFRLAGPGIVRTATILLGGPDTR
jgi:hypothetical protein